ncbi:MAG: SusC/RagA family TonB-linked outer membrane protein [Prolixibacteraceae bacterium]|nr:SusC/RagA family TonB-linked outer membrane protein [Prolixibacteraceae bacterium]
MKQRNIFMKQLKVNTGIFLLFFGIACTAFGQNIALKSSAKEIPDSSIIQPATNFPVNWESPSSVSTVQGKVIDKNSSYSTGNSLYGLLPGLIVRQQSGEPGSEDADFRIRGNGTFGNSNYPLILVDGFEHDLNSIAVEDIESISVLKDASASILYGGRAANGVIVVKTKRGIQGKGKISVKLLGGMQRPMGLPKFVNSADYATMYNQALASDGLPAIYSDTQIQGFRTGDPVFYPNVDWIKELVKNSAPAAKATVTATGGNNIIKYFVSVGYLMNQGLYDHTAMHDAYSTNIKSGSIDFRSNLDVQLTSDWKLTFDMFGQINDKNSPVASTASIWNSLNSYSSTIPIYVKDALLGGTSAFPINPMGLINEQGYRDTYERYVIFNSSTEYNLRRLVKGLVAGVRFGYDNYYTVNSAWSKTFESYSVIGTDPATGGPLLSAPFGKNTALAYGNPVGDSQSRRFNIDGYLDYNTTIGSENKLAAKLLYHQDKLMLGAESPYYNESLSGLVNYNLKNRYLVEVGLSYNGCEAFKPGKRFSLFPAVSAGWILSNESFLKDNPVIGFLKLRASTGIVGRSNLGLRFAYRDYYVGSGSYLFGTGTSATGGYIEYALSNPDLTYEKSHKSEIGVESVLWKNFHFSAAYFYQKRTNIIISQSNLVPSLVGVGLQDINGGKAENRGLELSLNIDKSFKEWGYFVGVNYTWMTSKVLYNVELPVPAGSEYYYRTGQKISQPYGLDFIGFFQSAQDIQSSPKQQFGSVKPGDMKYRDRNNDGFINQYDEGPIGNSVLPQSEFGLTLGANYKGFDIQGVFQAQMGRDIYLGSNPNIYWPLINYAKISTYVDQPWTDANKATANYPRLTTVSNPNNYRPSTFWYKNADFLRLRSVELGHNLPSQVTSKIKIDKVRLFVRGMNLVTLSSFTYGDPETMVGYPAMKSINMGLNVQF